ncbi:hypothetical protein OAB46_00470 [bacterium]|nr:hypothetical protein [Flavobacteriaceae bacterium]MDB9780279.1 hypothetical protein [bacterium]
MSYTETLINYVYEQYSLSDSMEDALNYLEDKINFSREEIREMIESTINKSNKYNLNP